MCCHTRRPTPVEGHTRNAHTHSHRHAPLLAKGQQPQSTLREQQQRSKERVEKHMLCERSVGCRQGEKVSRSSSSSSPSKDRAHSTTDTVSAANAVAAFVAAAGSASASASVIVVVALLLFILFWLSVFSVCTHTHTFGNMCTHCYREGAAGSVAVIGQDKQQQQQQQDRDNNNDNVGSQRKEAKCH